MTSHLTRRKFIAAAALLVTPRLALGLETQADMVIYGMTSGAVTAAIQARTMGLFPMIVGGWREKHVGGMMSGGLGGTDLDSGRAYGGLPRYIISLINAQGRRPNDQFQFEPRFAETVFNSLLKTYDIPVVRTRGIHRVRRSGSRLEAFETVDGQVFAARVFIDASYEGDLIAAAGISSVVGREARDGDNVLNGFRGTEQTDQGADHNFFSRRHLEKVLGPICVDPYVKAGIPGSGLLPGIRTYPQPEVGAADRAVQAYNFRMTMTRDQSRRVDFPTTAPKSFTPARYELLYRWIEVLKSRGLLENPAEAVKLFLLHNDLGDGIFDINNFGPVSTDLIGASWSYSQANYSERELLWKAHETWIRGLFYALQHHPDPRMPADLRDAFRQYGLDEAHYQDPHENDERHWPYQLYVREARRMVSDYQMSGREVAANGDMDPVDSRTIGCGSYNRDSHHTQRILRTSSNLIGMSTVSVWNEGNFEAAAGGTEKMFPIPYGAILPRRAECTNLLSIFAISATHEAFGATRMEMSLMQLGQSAAAAAALAAKSQSDMQDIPYDEVVSALFIPERISPPVLPRKVHPQNL
ncbi:MULTISPECIES: FAD-dependent oxidoreductase [Rhizobium/Agrobacterium group]|uniref:FAD-dependent oxidoreductase n=1 Tax=Rhizobium/Agrobacterium group TaxID=227290 RepID=UPI001AD9C68D|nr:MULTISPECIES: FAD-dependent oxidoreductase [Rhizobium/Agrobacterium group]MBO9112494.1 FAD-dependent oxidoreductase [Agrobacterium sp. S2/73]QXZ76000.1 FAD-dependent oxidoreductase [Agrobacterium sp. S7/73]QYA16989.1 FAD-dependent oxidoreductase [Rhizobium sp. AB2/73]UEQ85438.1 FAD-dependent oxidoreductase [Rhizobium sp. AB2/73]